MKRVVKGRLADKPDVKVLESKDGRKFNVALFTIFEADPTSAKDGESWPSMPRRCRAYGDACKDVMDYNKGDIITACATIKVTEYGAKDKEGNALLKEDGTPVIRRSEFLQFEKVDKSNTLDQQINQLLGAYVKGEIEKIDSGIDATFPAIEKVDEQTISNEMEQDLNQDQGFEDEFDVML